MVEENGTSQLEQCIIRQVEYYFGDVNLPRDKFLKEQIALDEGGWVPYDTMLKFKRLAALTEDSAAITAALAKSGTGLVEVSPDGAKLRRSPRHPAPELNDERRKELMTRTVYAKGLPKEGATLDDFLAFFAKYSTPESVIMRRYVDKPTQTHKFKGSVFVTFKTTADAQKFLDEDAVKYDDTQLITKWQADYLEEKRVEHEARYNKAVKKKQTEDAKHKDIVLPKRSVLVFTDVPEGLNRDAIKEAVTQLGADVAFIQIDEGKAWVRLQKEDSAKAAFDNIKDAKLKIEEHEVACELPDEQAEDKFLQEMANELMKRKKAKPKGGNKHFNNRKRRGGGGGGPPSKRK